MNIEEAKTEIINAMRAYFAKDEYGSYRIPPERQRPIFLMGPPGIGKTAVMEQAAAVLHVGLVSYSMTHHTRQSALGLPYIVKKTFRGKEYSISEYTMSEIIASVYEMIEETGHEEGILFLDEINCVSETLAPAMLEFLQYKIFGRHHVPEGWLVVTAGNPPEYNSSVRDFDVVTWDRLKRIDVEPDYEAWRNYAVANGIHPAVLTYLDAKRSRFYKVEATVDGRSFVTARGWSDLSEMIRIYEGNGTPVNERLISQYLQDEDTARDFAVYYDLFLKYRSDYQVEAILKGEEDPEIRRRAEAASFDERLSLLGLLLESVRETLTGVCEKERILTEVFAALKNVKLRAGKDADTANSLKTEADKLKERLTLGKRASDLSREEEKALKGAIACLSKLSADPKITFDRVKKSFDGEKKALKKAAGEGLSVLNALFAFAEAVFSEDEELLILVTELTIHPDSAHFISTYGCEKYFEHAEALHFHERQTELKKHLERTEG